ncbi:MAG: peptidase M19 [Bacteroidota bacterium]
MSSENNTYVDLHCHSALKPYGKSFNRRPVGRNTTRRSRRNSIWKYDPPSLTDKLLNYVINLTKFSQANFTSLAKGDVRVVCASLYPMEKGFFVNAIKSDFLRDLIGNFATGIGKKRVDAVQGMTDYFQDLEREYDFYKQLEDKAIRLPEGQFTYKLVHNYGEIRALLEQEPGDGPCTIAVVLSIEGLHVLNGNLDAPPDEAAFLRNLYKIKAWEAPPLIVGPAHHFWNHICGHAPSFTDLVAKNVDQSEGLGTGITPLGEKVIHALLDDTQGKRILVDVKHMSVASRYAYYNLIREQVSYAGVPLVVTHGAASGLWSPGNPEAGGSGVAKTLNPVSINFYNDELILMARGKGIFGLQLDERRVAGKETLKKTKHSVKRSKIMHYRSELLWNQIRHIAEVLDGAGLFAWDLMAIGSDFDGIVDPLNAFWTAEELPFLADFLERHAYNYMKDSSLQRPENRIDADEVVHRIMTQNALDFLERNFV